MQTAFIMFSTREDRAKGFYELILRTRVNSLPGELYQVPNDALKILDELAISYRRATEEEVKNAMDQVRNPSPSVL